MEETTNQRNGRDSRESQEAAHESAPSAPQPAEQESERTALDAQSDALRYQRGDLAGRNEDVETQISMEAREEASGATGTDRHREDTHREDTQREVTGEAPPDGPAPEGPTSEGPTPEGPPPERLPPVEPLGPELAALVEDMETYDLSMEALALEEEIDRMENLAIPALEEQAQGIDHMEREVEALFEGAYRDPELARAHYDQTAILQGPEEASRKLRESPADYGDLKGGFLRLRQNREVQEALAALEHRGEAYHRALHAAEQAEIRGGEFFDRQKRGGVEVEAEVEADVGRERGAERNEKEAQEPRTRNQGERGRESTQSEHTDGGREPESGAPAERRGTFDQQLERLYEDPEAARRNFEKVEQRLGTDRAASGLARRPEGLGRLKAEVSRSEAVRDEYARAAASAARDPRRATVQTRRTTVQGGAKGARRSRHASLDAARDRVRRLRAQVRELYERIRQRSASSRHMRGLSRGQMRQSIERRLQALSKSDRNRVIRTFTRRLLDRGKLASILRGGHGIGGAARLTAKKGVQGVGMAAGKLGLGSAAASIALHVAERSVRRGVEETTGREIFSR